MRTFVTMLLAAAPLAYAPAGLAQSTDRKAGPAMHKVLSDLTGSYLRTWSTPQGASDATVARVYGPRIQFYGRVLDRPGLVAEKRRFVRRWPVRHYAVRPGTLRVACDGPSGLCRVASVLDWRAQNPARRALAQGSSSFEQRFDVSTRQPAVVHESGRVLQASRAGRG